MFIRLSHRSAAQCVHVWWRPTQHDATKVTKASISASPGIPHACPHQWGQVERQIFGRGAEMGWSMLVIPCPKMSEKGVGTMPYDAGPWLILLDNLKKSSCDKSDKIWQVSLSHYSHYRLWTLQIPWLGMQCDIMYTNVGWLSCLLELLGSDWDRIRVQLLCR